MYSVMENGFLNITLGGWIERLARFYPENDAVVNVKRGVRINYRELNEKAREVGKGLLKMGIKKGDHVAIWATNYRMALPVVWLRENRRRSRNR